MRSFLLWAFNAISFDDGSGIRHSVQVTAETLFEAAAVALHMFEQAGDPPGPAAHLEIAAHTPIVKHAVTVQRVRDLLSLGAYNLVISNTGLMRA